MLHLCVSGPVYVLDDVEVVLTNREVHFTFTTCIYFCSRNLLRIMVKINSAKSISEIREISIIMKAILNVLTETQFFYKDLGPKILG